MMTTMSQGRPMMNRFQVFSGSDFVGRVTAKAAPTTSQRILLTLDISPSAFPGTRLTQLSQLWERYRFVRASFRYIPAVPHTMACQFLLYCDTDPTDDPTLAVTYEELIRQGVAQSGSRQWNFNNPMIAPLALRADDQLYYTGDTELNPRFSLQGRLYLIQITDPVNVNGELITTDTAAGSVYLDWTVKFQVPQINPAGFAMRSGGADDVIITVDAAAINGLVDWATSAVQTLAGLKPNAKYIITYRPTSTTFGGAADIFDGGNWYFIPLEEPRKPTVIPSNRIGVTCDAGAQEIYVMSSEPSVVWARTDQTGNLHYIIYASSSIGVTDVTASFAVRRVG